MGTAKHGRHKRTEKYAYYTTNFSSCIVLKTSPILYLILFSSESSLNTYVWQWTLYVPVPGRYWQLMACLQTVYIQIQQLLDRLNPCPHGVILTITLLIAILIILRVILNITLLPVEQAMISLKWRAVRDQH